MSSFLSHKYKMIFCHIPRTGGTSFTEAIRPYLGAYDEIETAPKHSPFRYFTIGRFGKYFDDYLKVSILRNQQERKKSLCIGAENAAPRINEDDRAEYWWTNEQWLCDRNGKIMADVLINFDGLPGSALKFLRTIGIYLDEYPHLNSRGKG